MEMIQLTILCSGMSVASYEMPEVEIGRQQDGEPPPFERFDDGPIARVIVAANANRYFPRRLLRLSVETLPFAWDQARLSLLRVEPNTCGIRVPPRKALW